LSAQRFPGTDPPAKFPSTIEPGRRHWAFLDFDEQEIFARVAGGVRRVPFVTSVYRRALWYKLINEQGRSLRRFGRFVEVSIGDNGILLDLSQMHDFVMFYDIARGKGYEDGTLGLLERTLKSGDTFVDVGANNGYFSIAALPHVGESGKVISFEPSPSAFLRLTANWNKTGRPANWIIKQLALGEVSGRARLFRSPQEDGQDSLVRAQLTSVEVEVRQLDDELINTCPKLIKVDTEGSEESVLNGTQNTLRNCLQTSLIIEWNRFSRVEFWNRLWSKFDISRIPVHSGKPLRRLMPSAPPQGLCNVLCSPRFKEGRL